MRSFIFTIPSTIHTVTYVPPRLHRAHCTHTHRRISHHQPSPHFAIAAIRYRRSSLCSLHIPGPHHLYLLSYTLLYSRAYPVEDSRSFESPLTERLCAVISEVFHSNFFEGQLPCSSGPETCAVEGCMSYRWRGRCQWGIGNVRCSNFASSSGLYIFNRPRRFSLSSVSSCYTLFASAFSLAKSPRGP